MCARRGDAIFMAVRHLALIVAAVALSGCFQARYLAQASVGQVQLLTRSRPLSSVIDDHRTDDRTGKLLAQVPRIKRFGERNGLTATRNYERFTQLDRPAAVWVVQGCEPLSFEMRRWTFPIVGSVPYLGYFHEPDARVLAALLAGDGLDVEIRPASAYSTLGWFKDPVLSTMLSKGDDALGQLAEVVLHESVHATVYVKGQSAFDESLAQFVGSHLARDWLSRAASPRELRAYVDGEARGAKVVARLHRAFDELDALYKGPLPDADKLAKKAELLEALQAELGLKRKLNNASLAGFRTYDTGGPAFERLFAACGKDWQRFLDAVRTLREEDFPEHQLEEFSPVVDALAGRGCPAHAR